MKHLWAFPCTLVGLLLAWCGGAKRAGGLFFVAPPRGPWAWFFARGFLAITFGEVVVFQARYLLDSDALVAHELRHVAQYHRFGVFFPFLYGLFSLVAWIMGGAPHRDNWFEIDAQRAARDV